MEYHIHQEIPTSQYIQIKLVISCHAAERITLQLPSWRPGRYELADYAQKIRRIEVYSELTQIPLKKTTKDRWEFLSVHEGRYTISYEYFCNQLDAGGCWADSDMVYVNFSNIALAVSNRSEEEVDIQLHIPDHYQVATPLKQKSPFGFWAANYQELLDSPLIASPSLKHYTYRVGITDFYLWFQGEIHVPIPALLNVFQAFTERQIAAFGEFPADEYHFLFHLLPYHHYHGVEHKYATVITYGPAESLTNPAALAELLSVSSHELYHFWNVCRIRPKAIFPYDLSREAYFREGLIAEGVTTYFGDMYLLRAGFYSLESYLAILAQKINRETVSHGWQYQSIVDSSFDLWLDGYKPSIPDRKVSIYNRGALLSLCLDLMLMDRNSSLEEVMRVMWLRYGRDQKGYVLEDFQRIVIECAQDPFTMQSFFDRFVHGTEDLLPTLIVNLRSVDVHLEEEEDQNELEMLYGIQLDDTKRITRLHPASPAYRLLMLGDLILSFQTGDDSIKLEIDRISKKIPVSIPKTTQCYFKKYKLVSGEAENPKKKAWVR